MQKFLLFTVLIILISTFSCTTTEKGRFYEEEGGYSIVIPENWEAVKISDLKYHLIREISAVDFTPNINFTIEGYDITMDEYTDAVIEQLKNILGDDFTVLQQVNFPTLNKLIGKKLIITNNYIRHTYYFFQGSSNIFITSVCTSLENNSEDYDILFNKIMETFKIEIRGL
jgi:hypothetical protein